MSNRLINPVWLSVFALLMVGFAAANVPLIIPLQGKLLNSTGSVITGSRTVNFTYFTAAVGGQQLRSDARDGANNISVVNGFFDVLLGDDNNSLAEINFSQPVFLEINVSGEVLAPRMRLGASPYAITSQRVFGVQTDLDESLVSLNNTLAGAVNAVLNIVQNSGNGSDFVAPSFRLRNGILNVVSVNATTNFTGPTLTRAFIGNGSSLTSLDASNLANGTVPDGRLSGTYTGALQFTGASNNYSGTEIDLSQTLNRDALVVNKTATGAGTVLDLLNYGTGLSLNLRHTTDTDSVVLFKNGTAAGVAFNVSNSGNGTGFSLSQYGNASGLVAAKTSTGSGDVLNVSQNSGTGNDLNAPSFTLRNGILNVVSINTTANHTGPTALRAFIGNGSSLTDLDAGNLVNGTLPDGRISGTYTGALVFSGANNNYTGRNLALVQNANQNLLNLSKAGGGATGAGNIINISNNAGTGSDINAPSFTLRNGIVEGVSINATTNFTGPTLTRAFIGNGSSLTDLDAGNLVNGTLPSGRLSGNYSGILNFQHGQNNYSGGNISIDRNSSFGVGVAANLSQRTADEALSIQQYANANGVLIEKLGTGTGPALVIENSGSGTALNLSFVGNGNVTFNSSYTKTASARTNSHWIGNTTQPEVIYANASVDDIHQGSAFGTVQINNSAVTADSIILLQIARGSGNPGAQVTLWVNGTSPGSHFNVSATNSTTLAAMLGISYIIIN